MHCLVVFGTYSITSGPHGFGTVDNVAVIVELVVLDLFGYIIVDVVVLKNIVYDRLAICVKNWCP